VRFPLLLALALSVVASAAADRLITIPTGRKIPFMDIKFDSFADLSAAKNWDRFVGIGVSPEIELDYHGERFAGGPMKDTFNASYNYVPPITNQSPGLSIGVQDILNRTREGRRYFIAATWRESVDNVGSGNLPMDVTIGVSQGARALPMVGVNLPVSERFRLLVEHDGFRLAAGLEYRALKNAFGARVIVRDQSVMVGANLTLRF